MKLSIDDIQALIRIADCGSFQSAATALHLTPSALSRRIGKFESIAGAKLFERTTHSLALTSFGKNIIDEARHIQGQFETFEKLVHQSANYYGKEIVLACLTSVAGSILPKLIKEFREEYPDAWFTVLDMGSDQMIDRVLQRDVDFAIDINKGPQHDSIVYNHLCEEPFVLGIAEGDYFYTRKHLTWSDVLTSDKAVLGIYSSHREILETVFADKDISLPQFYEMDNMSTQLGFTENGLIAAILPKLALAYNQSKTIRMIPLIEPEISREISLIYRKTTPFSELTLKFIQFIKKRFSHAYIDTLSHFDEDEKNKGWEK